MGMKKNITEKNQIEKKSKGRVYTPDYIVKNILDMAHYRGKTKRLSTENTAINRLNGFFVLL